jgi:hypothetical protein
MSPRPEGDPAAACVGKIRYEPHQAEVAIKTAARMRRAHSSPVRAYRCLCCGGWHVGRPMSKRGLH